MRVTSSEAQINNILCDDFFVQGFLWKIGSFWPAIRRIKLAELNCDMALKGFACKSLLEAWLHRLESIQSCIENDDCMEPNECSSPPLFWSLTLSEGHLVWQNRWPFVSPRYQDCFFASEFCKVCTIGKWWGPRDHQKWMPKRSILPLLQGQRLFLKYWKRWLAFEKAKETADDGLLWPQVPLHEFCKEMKKQEWEKKPGLLTFFYRLQNFIFFSSYYGQKFPQTATLSNVNWLEKQSESDALEYSSLTCPWFWRVPKNFLLGNGLANFIKFLCTHVKVPDIEPNNDLYQLPLQLSLFCFIHSLL